MFSSWWPHSLSSHSQDEDTATAQVSTSFRLPKTSSSHSNDSQTTKTGRGVVKKHSKRKQKKDGSKSKKKEQDSDTKSRLKLRLGALDSPNEDVCTVTFDRDNTDGDMNSTGYRPSTKEHCRVVNLKIPLPSQTEAYTFQVLKQKQAEQASKPKNLQALDSPRLASSSGYRRKSLGVGEMNDQERQPVLKSVELVNFANDEQSAANQYLQHQRSLAKSSCITVPSLANSSFLVNLTHRPGSASTWKDLHPPPSPFPQTPTHGQRKPHPSTEYPDLLLSSKQLQAHIPVDSLSVHHNMQDYIFRPVFRYSHRGSLTQSSAKHCSCTDGCQQCMVSNTRLIHPSSLTLDGYKQLHDRFNRDKSSCKHRVHSNGSSVSIDLPPLEAVPGDSERDMQSLSLQAQGLSIMRHPPKALYTQRRTERVPLGSTTTSRSKRDVFNYPDPLVGGLPSYHRKLAQMSALVTETIRVEKEKASKSKSKKAASGSGTPRNGNSGSLGSL